MVKILICDHTSFADQCEKKLKQIAREHMFDVNIDIMTSGKQVLFYLETPQVEVDIIFLEYHLLDGNGIEVARTLRQRGITADIIFYTKDESHALDGYDVGALHYLIKHATDEAKFEQVAMRAVQRAEKRKEEVISLSCAGEQRTIEINCISYFEVRKRIITVHYGNQETFEFYSTISRLEEMLYSKGFIRIHQAYLVAEKYIRRKTKQTVVMLDESVLPIGRSYQEKMSRLTRLKEIKINPPNYQLEHCDK